MRACAVISEMRDLAVSFVSLGERMGQDKAWRSRRDVLDNIECCEKDKLRFIICAHPLNVWFENFNNLFSIL